MTSAIIFFTIADIADVFFRANYIERAGTGLLRVKKTLEQMKHPPLQLSEEGPFFIVTLPRQNLVLVVVFAMSEGEAAIFG